MNDHCYNCGSPVQIMIFRGTHLCSDRCYKQWMKLDLNSQAQLLAKMVSRQARS